MNGDSSICNGCGKSEPDVRFGKRTVRGKQYPKHLCNKCYNMYKDKYRNRNPNTVKAANVRGREKRKQDRKLGLNRARFILHDAKRSDNKKKLDNDLNHEFIVNQIADGCRYCGETSITMTLDRIDNSIGHIKSNVIAACMRCNYLRRDVPIAAWMIIAPAVRQARVAGAFGEWNGSMRKKSGRLGKLENPSDLGSELSEFESRVAYQSLEVMRL